MTQCEFQGIKCIDQIISVMMPHTFITGKQINHFYQTLIQLSALTMLMKKYWPLDVKMLLTQVLFLLLHCNYSLHIVCFPLQTIWWSHYQSFCSCSQHEPFCWITHMSPYVMGGRWTNHNRIKRNLYMKKKDAILPRKQVIWQLNGRLLFQAFYAKVDDEWGCRCLGSWQK